MSTTIGGVPIILMPDLGVVTDDSSIVGEHAGSGRFGAAALSTPTPWAARVVATGSTASRALPIRWSRSTERRRLRRRPERRGRQHCRNPGGIQRRVRAVSDRRIHDFRSAHRDLDADHSWRRTVQEHLENHLGHRRHPDPHGARRHCRSCFRQQRHAHQRHLCELQRCGRLPQPAVAVLDDQRLPRRAESPANDIQVVDGQIFSTGVPRAAAFRSPAGLALAISRCYLQQGAAPGVGFGIRLLNCGDLLIADCSLAACGTALAVVPGSGQGVVSLWAHHTYFDTSQNGVNIGPSGTGSVYRSRFDNCWMSSAAADGIAITSPAAGAVSGISFLGCHVFGNGNNGFLFTDANAQVTKIVDCEIAGNATNGIDFFAGGNYFMVRGCGRSAAFGGWGNNGGAAINLGAASSAYHITDNDLTGSTGSLVGSGVQTGGSPGRTEFIGRNIGYTDSTYGSTALHCRGGDIGCRHSWPRRCAAHQPHPAHGPDRHRQRGVLLGLGGDRHDVHHQHAGRTGRGDQHRLAGAHGMLSVRDAG